jgi:hypothetical protein
MTKDQTITKLHTENSQLKRTNQALAQDLNLTQRVIRLKDHEPFTAD